MARRKTTKASAKRHLIVLDAESSGEDVRHEILGEREFLVAPVVALVECVMSCSTCSGPTYVPAEAIIASAEDWEGIPLTLDHPELEEGRVTLASHPDADALIIGVFRNVAVDEAGDLTGELWIDLEKLAAKAGGPDVIAALEAGEVVQVSIGALSREIEREGNFGGKHFAIEIEALAPDHLAVLRIGEQGACNPDMGCGANLAAALAAKGIRPEHGVIPVQLSFDEATFQRGLADLMASSLTITTTDKEKKMSKPTTTAAKCGCQDSVFGKLVAAMKFTAAEVSDQDLRTSLEMALKASLGEGSYFWIVAVFSDAVVYSTGADYLRRTFKAAKDGAVTLGEAIEKVRPVTSFVAAEADPKPGDAPAPDPDPEPEPAPTPEPAPAPTPDAPPSEPTPEPKPRTVSDLAAAIEASDPALARELRESATIRATKRASLAASLGVDPNEVAALPLETLEKMVAAKPAPAAPAAPEGKPGVPPVPTFAGRGAPAAPVAAADAPAVPKPPKLIEPKAA
jgi:hypothetical protein